MSNATGYIPRDYKSFPVGSLPYETRWDESEIPLMSMKEAAEKCEHDAEHGIDPLGVAISTSTMPTFQNGFPFCWAHAGVMAQKISMAQSGMVVPRLSPTGPACLIKGYRNRGGNAVDIIPWLAEHGAPTVEFWEENSKSRSNDTPEMRENAKLHRVLEWWVLPDRSDQHKWTALANGYALWSGYANIGHAMCSARFFLDSRGRPGCLDINSWNKGASNATAWQEGWMRDRNVIYQRIGRDFTSFEQYAVRVSTVAA